MIVRVYRNLRNKKDKRPLYSVLYRGRVIKRVRRILLADVEFIVRESGRQRVLREQRKNVHAFVKGRWVQRGGAMGQDANGKDFGMRISYNPYKNATFVYNAPGCGYDQKPVKTAMCALLNERGCSACYTD